VNFLLFGFDPWQTHCFDASSAAENSVDWIGVNLVESITVSGKLVLCCPFVHLLDLPQKRHEYYSSHNRQGIYEYRYLLIWMFQSKGQQLHRESKAIAPCGTPITTKWILILCRTINQGYLSYPQKEEEKPLFDSGPNRSHHQRYLIDNRSIESSTE
jgi:hypothetical protein